VDLNQLLYHHQMALMAANQARRDGEPLPNFDLPRYYAKRISEYRAKRGLDDTYSAVTDEVPVGPKADPATSEPVTGYPAFIGDTLIAAILVSKVLSLTPEERTAAALDGIVDRLAEMQEELWVIGHDIYQALELDGDGLAALAEDVSFSSSASGDEAVRMTPFRSQSEEGIEHIYTEQFRVGPFRYSNIEDARAGLLRLRIGIGQAGGQANDV